MANIILMTLASATFDLRRLLMAVSMVCPMLCGCASSISHNDIISTTTEKAIIANVPFTSQKANYCGPASLAMVMSYWRRVVTQDEIAEEIYRTSLKGTLSVELAAYAMKNNFDVDIYNGNITDLKEKISMGFPLIASQRSKRDDELVHYLVVFGFDDAIRKIYVHSGARKNMSMKYDVFIKQWDLADKLTFFIRGKRP